MNYFNSINKVTYWMCNKCGHIQYHEMKVCPKCSENKSFTYSSETGVVKK